MSPRKSALIVVGWFVSLACGGDDGVVAGGTTTSTDTTGGRPATSGPITGPGTTEPTETMASTGEPVDTTSSSGATSSSDSTGMGETSGSGSSTTGSGSSTTDSAGSTTGSGTTATVDECADETTGGDVGVPVLPDDCAGDVLDSDVFLPGEVYLAGTLSEGACYLDAMAHWSAPDEAVAGFDCYFDNRSAIIRPNDGRLLYTNTFEGYLREFHCDTCPIAPGDDYPDTPLNNDTVLATPACDPEKTVSLGFLIAPEGWYAYRCAASDTTWYDEEGDVFYDENEELLHLGYGYALTESSVVRLCDGEMIPIDGLPAGAPMTIRAEPDDGFLVVMTPAQPELWHVSTTGTATSMGVYPEVPAGYSAGFGAALDACGALFQLGGGPMVFEDVILRRELGGTTDIVYTELDEPYVAIHISDLVTGS